MSDHGHLSASQIRARLDHPIIDADGHWVEFDPILEDAFRRIGGEPAAQGIVAAKNELARRLHLSVAERREQRIGQETWWSYPTRVTRDRATSLMPRLQYERHQELGIDFSILYPTRGLGLAPMRDDTMRRATCSAYNVYAAERFAKFSDRMTPAAIIPMYTPEEAIEELEHVRRLGMKVIMMGSLIPRPMPGLAKRSPEAAQAAPWYDVLGLDSTCDYDPVWAKCAELRLSPSFHSGSRGLGLRRSPVNFSYNHIGHFAAAGEAVCKAIFMGGVTRRFPGVNFAFLEGGAAWACQLFASLLEHWEKRCRQGLEWVNPANLDRALLLELAETYAEPDMLRALREGRGVADAEGSVDNGGLQELDDFSACRVGSAEELRDLFTTNFYFGCEADDRLNAWAFNRRANPLGARLNAMFSSDIGHLDVSDARQVVPEAYELLEDELLTAEDFRDFMFANAVRFWGRANPEFFRGTAVEQPAAAVLAEAGRQPKQAASPA